MTELNHITKSTELGVTDSEIQCPVEESYLESELRRVESIEVNSSQVTSIPATSAVEMGIGKIVGFNGGCPLIELKTESQQLLIKAVGVACSLDVVADIGRFVCLAFDQQDLARPLVLGKITHGLPENHLSEGSPLELDSPQGIVFRSGKACISLKPDGTVAIRGTNVASRASHTNRIRGGNVQIN